MAVNEKQLERVCSFLELTTLKMVASKFLSESEIERGALFSTNDPVIH